MNWDSGLLWAWSRRPYGMWTSTILHLLRDKRKLDCAERKNETVRIKDKPCLVPSVFLVLVLIPSDLQMHFLPLGYMTAIPFQSVFLMYLSQFHWVSVSYNQMLPY